MLWEVFYPRSTEPLYSASAPLPFVQFIFIWQKRKQNFPDFKPQQPELPMTEVMRENLLLIL